MTINEMFGEKIMIARKIKKMSQSELSQKAEVNRSTISEIENGKVNTSLELADKLANILGVKITIGGE